MNSVLKNKIARVKIKSLIIILCLALFSAPPAVLAQTSGPIYVVQPGDTLFNIARDFGVTQADLQKANNITDPTKIAVGQQLTLPGFEGVSGKVSTYKVKPGETFVGLARRLGLTLPLATKLNRLTNPALLYVGQRFTYLEGGKGLSTGRVNVIQPNESLLTLAARTGKNPWELAFLNEAAHPYVVAPGQQAITPIDGVPLTGLPTPFNALSIKSERLIPGGTLQITAQVNEGTKVGGTFVGKTLNFAPDAAGQVAVQGIHRFTEGGLYPLVVSATAPSGLVTTFEQMLPIADANPFYPDFQRVNVSPELKDLLDTELRNREFGQIEKLATVYAPTRLWKGVFTRPIQSDRITTPFGVVRSYNGGPLDNFHGGIDYGADGGAPIFAPANGVVLYVGELKVRGRVTLIDHGWGVVTGYWHQYKLHVQVGQQVKAGEVIGDVGSSGLSTGPHLHFEVWVGGNEVNPDEWLKTEFP